MPKNYKILILSCFLLLSYGCDSSPVYSGNAEIERLIVVVDRGSNKERCQALGELYTFGKDAIPYLIAKIDEQRVESFGLKNPNYNILVLDEENIETKHIGVFYAYVIEFILLQNNMSKAICGENGHEILPKGHITFVSPFGMINKTVKDGADYKKFRNLTSKDMSAIKNRYNSWWVRNENYTLKSLREYYIHRRNYPLKDSIYYWY